MKANIRKLLKRVYGFCFKPFFKRGILINIGGAGKYRFHHIFVFSRLGAFGTRHNSGFHKWLKMCRGKKTVFDIGAHIGLYSIPASSALATGGFIYAFEPSSANRLYLEEHIRFNHIDNIKVVPYVVGAKTLDGVAFYESSESDPMDSVVIRKKEHSYNKVMKRQISLDDFIETNGIAPEVIKLDVEGSELDVLRGSRRMLAKCNPIIFLSVHPVSLELLGQSAEELIRFTESLDYSVRDTSGKEVRDLQRSEYILIPRAGGVHEVF